MAQEPRIITVSGHGASSSTVSPWSHEVLSAAAHRAGTIAALLGAIMLASLALGGLASATGFLPGDAANHMFIIGPAFLVLCATMYVISRRENRPPSQVVNIAFAFQITICLLLSVSDNLAPWPNVPRWVSWTGLIIVVFPAILPATNRKTFFVALVCALTGPLSLPIGLITQGDLPGFGQVFFSYYPTFVCVAIAVVLHKIVHEMGAFDTGTTAVMGQYKLESRLGKGGMGEVWLGKHALLARPAAVKLIRPDTLDAGQTTVNELLTRFNREARATAGLRSPHTVQLYDFGVTNDGTFYYAMELLEGLNLEQLVIKHGPTPPARTRSILEQMCRSLADAHNSGLIHRDIKPANVYLCRLGVDVDFVKVLDFGLVKVTRGIDQSDGNLTLQNVVVGTPAFLAPEMAIAGGNVDARADIYMVGCVGYWLLTGRTVFNAKSSTKMLIHHVRTPPQPVGDVSPHDVPDNLADLIMKCLEKKADDRPQTAFEVVELLAGMEIPGWSDADAQRWWKSHAAQIAADTKAHIAETRKSAPVTEELSKKAGKADQR